MSKKSTARGLLYAYDNGKLTWPQLVAAFNDLPMAVQKPITGGWGALYAKAEEINWEDVPEALASAECAGIIDSRQEQELIAIYDRKIS